MRIGHIGTGGTGKSTLAKELAECLDLEYRKSVVREVYAEFGWTEASQRTASPEDCWRLQKEIFARKLYQDKYHGKDVVFDRTPIDHLAYCVYRCEAALNEEILRDYELVTHAAIRAYDVVIYHPIPSWNAEPDGLREDDYVYRRIIDTLMLGYLTSFQVSYAIVPDADITVQRDSLYEYIQGMMPPEPTPGALAIPVETRAANEDQEKGS